MNQVKRLDEAYSAVFELEERFDDVMGEIESSSTLEKLAALKEKIDRYDFLKDYEDIGTIAKRLCLYDRLKKKCEKKLKRAKRKNKKLESIAADYKNEEENYTALVNTFEPLREIEPETRSYREIKNVLLGFPIPEMPKKEPLRKRLDFVAEKAAEYDILNSKQDIEYFRAVADVLVDLIRNGLLNRDGSSADSAVNSIIYLLDRSEYVNAA